MDRSRRDLFTRIGLVSLFASLGLACVGCLRFLFPKVFYEPETRFKVGRPSDFPKGTIRFLKDRRVYIFRDDEGFWAMSAICTHLGCVATQANKGFLCPCHGSNFSLDGSVVSGPAPQGLPWLEVSISADGYLVVDANKTVHVGTRFTHA